MAKLPIKMTEEEFYEYSNSNYGICLACGEYKEGECEPDAEGYECDMCGANEVQGIENAMISGKIEIIDSEDEE